MDNTLEVKIWPLISHIPPSQTSFPLAIEITDTNKDALHHYSLDLYIDCLGKSYGKKHWMEKPAFYAKPNIVRFEKTLELPLIPSSGRENQGFGIFLALDAGDGRTAQAKTALEAGISSLRYGFLTKFESTDGFTREQALDFLLQQHCTHVQFYDWSFRPQQYRPEAGECKQNHCYQDLMGKPIDLNVVQKSIELLHKRGLEALAYGAVYASSKDYLDKHPGQGLHDNTGKPLSLIDTFFIMNISKGNPWRTQLFLQYRYATEILGFDGIHMDTYGYPKIAYDDTGKKVYLADEFTTLIDEWTKQGTHNIFNNVGNWPTDPISTRQQEALYIEVWDPYTEYRHLRLLINSHLACGKPMVLAAYSLSFKQGKNLDRKKALASTCLLMATIFSHGATPLLFGENGGILTQPYYVDYTPMTKEEQKIVTSYNDFAVQYSQLLFDPALQDVTESFAFGENREFDFRMVPEKGSTSCDGQANTLWPIVHMDKHLVVINFINLIGQHDSLWNTGKNPVPEAMMVTLHLPCYDNTMQFYTASPDIDQGKPHPVAWKPVEGQKGLDCKISLAVESYWTLLWAEL